MKTLGTFIVLLFSATFIHAQEAIELKEARVESVPLFELSGDQNHFVIKIGDNHARDFERCPITFLEKHIPLQEIVDYAKNRENSFYVLTIRSKKGQLKANFDAKGNLLRTSYKFNNVTLPYKVIQQIYMDHPGWSLAGNSFFGKARPGKTNQSSYQFILKNGKETREITLPLTQSEFNGIANL